MNSVTRLNKSVIRALWLRELRIMWPRMVIIMGWLVFGYIKFMEHPPQSGEKDFFFFSSLMIGLVLGVDFGLRDRNNGFKSLLLVLPVQQGWLNLVRFSARLIPFAISAFSMMILEHTGYRIEALDTVFHMSTVFLVSVSVSLVVRKTVIAICLAPVILGGWYTVAVLVCFSLSSLYPDNIGLYRMFMIAPMPMEIQFVGITYLSLITALTITTLLGIRRTMKNSINATSFGQLGILWCVVAILYICVLAAVPAYCSSLPIESAVGIGRIMAIPGSDLVSVTGYFRVGLPTSRWILRPDGNHYPLEKRQLQYLQFHEGTSYFSCPNLDYYSKDEVQEFIYQYSISDEGEFQYEEKCKLKDRISWTGTKHYLFHDPTNSRLCAYKYAKGLPNTIYVVDFKSGCQAIELQLSNRSEKDQLYPIGWMDSDTIVATRVSKSLELEFWLMDTDGENELLYSTEPGIKVMRALGRYPMAYYNEGRQSIIFFTGRNPPVSDPNINPENLKLREYFLSGALIDHKSEMITEHLQDARLVGNGESIIMNPRGGSILYNLFTGVYSVFEDASISIDNFSPDARHYIYSEKTEQQEQIHRRRFYNTRNLWIRRIDDSEELLRIDGVNLWVWQDDDHLFILKTNGKLGRINIHSGEFHEYCDFDWRQS